MSDPSLSPTRREDVPTWLGIDVFQNEWLDGSGVYYTNWLEGEPNERCAVANFGNGGLWLSKDCSSQGIARSLCEVPQGNFVFAVFRYFYRKVENFNLLPTTSIDPDVVCVQTMTRL